MGASLYKQLDILPTSFHKAWYFLKTRAWELLAGSVLAAYTHKRTTLSQENPKKHDTERAKSPNALSIFLRQQWLQHFYAKHHVFLHNGLSIIALLLITLPLFFSNDQFYPTLMVAIPIVGAVVIMAQNQHTIVARYILSHPIAVYIGKISYPLYLIHWPLLSFAVILNHGKDVVYQNKYLLGIASVVLSVIVYEWVEKNLRYKEKIVPKLLMALVMMAAYSGAISKQFIISQVRTTPEAFNILSNR